MKIFLCIVIGVFFLLSLILSIYGYFNLREVKRGEMDLGIVLPKKVKRFFSFTLWFSFLSTILLAILGVWILIQGV